MKYTPGSTVGELPIQTGEILGELQERRNFEPENYLEAKTTLLNGYMSEAGLKSCVVAVSGGIDSALVLGIVQAAAQQPGSPIERIFPIALPVYRDKYTKNQPEATAKGKEVCEAFGMDLIEVDLTDTYDTLKETVDRAIGVEGEDWANGQLAAYDRPAALYYTTSLCTQIDKPAIICGTTNRDEGAYLGYVGKASDGMVDVQLISDLHKSEVRELSRHLGVPQSILDAEPTGDMFDGRVDEEVFGASYEYVQLFLMLKSLDPKEAEAFLNRLGHDERQAYEIAQENLEGLHKYNAHKYGVGSPAVHLDVLESGVPDGWHYTRQKPSRRVPSTEKVNNYFGMSERAVENVLGHLGFIGNANAQNLELPKGEAAIIENAAEPFVVAGLLCATDSQGWKPTGITGYAEDYQDGDQIGSYRASTYSPEFADYLWTRIARHFASPRVFDDDPQVDVEPGSVWRPVGVAPLLRFIKYEEGGVLVPHYDAPYTYENENPTYYDKKMMTLKSLVLYLAANGIEGGATRFLKDELIDQPIAEGGRDLSDRQELATDDDVLLRVDPSPGSALVFDHRILHDAEPVLAGGEDSRKVIIRTDVVYAQC